MEGKKILIHVCTFVCGLVVGGGLPKGEMPNESNCKFWKFIHKGHVWGIIDNVVDINLFNGTQDEFRDYIQAKGIKVGLENQV